MNKVEQRFIESITYLRKLGFFEEYSNLTSEEIFKRMEEEDIMLKDLERDEERWMKKSVFGIDSYVAISDEKRTWGMDVEMGVGPGDNAEILKGLARISRGVFQPEDVKEGPGGEVHFKYKGKRHVVEFRYDADFLKIRNLLCQINRIIEYTGYKYYLIPGGGQVVSVVVLTEEEEKKLASERGWKLIHP